MKLDSFGNLIWENLFVMNGFSTAVYALSKNSNSYVICGDSYNGNNEFRVYFKIFDINGSLVFTKLFSANENEFSSEIGIIGQNKFVISITKRHYVPPNVNEYTKLLITDSVGNIQTEKEYFAPGDLVIKSIFPVNNGDILFAGFASYSYSTRADIYALRTDSLLYAPPPIGLKNFNEVIPGKFTLNSSPNPFNAKVSIKYGIPNACKLKIVVYEILGNETKILVNESKYVGNYEVNWNAENYASGIYFVSLFTNDRLVLTRKIVLLK